MALNNKRTNSKLIKDRSGTNNITSDVVTEASSSISSDIFSNDPAYTGGTLSPMLYHMDLLQEDVDEIRRYITGSFSVPSRIGTAGVSGDIGAGTEVFELHNAQTLQAGAICYSGASSWAYANATSAGAASYGFMGVTTSTSTSTGLVTRGVVYLNTDPGGSVGDIVYLSTTNGILTTTAPSTSGNVVRVMGHKIGTNLVYFNPSTNWIELS